MAAGVYATEIMAAVIGIDSVESAGDVNIADIPMPDVIFATVEPIVVDTTGVTDADTVAVTGIAPTVITGVDVTAAMSTRHIVACGYVDDSIAADINNVVRFGVIAPLC